MLIDWSSDGSNLVTLAGAAGRGKEILTLA